MKLSQLHQIQQDLHLLKAELAKEVGATHAFHDDLFVEVLPVDFEQLTQEKYPDKHWCSPGAVPTQETKFAYWGDYKNRVTVSSKFDYLK
jgi:hypothetical protein